MKKEKEIRAFVVDAGKYESNGYEIDDWSDTPEGEELCEKAQHFISFAEQSGRVYSLKGLMVAFNINEEISPNDWIFITNKY